MSDASTVRAAYVAFEVADVAHQVELRRVYGNAAGDMRYQPSRYTDEALIATHKALRAANEVWHAATVAAREGA